MLLTNIFTFLGSTEKTQCLKSSQYSEKFCPNKVCTPAVSYLDRGGCKQKAVCGAQYNVNYLEICKISQWVLCAPYLQSRSQLNTTDGVAV